MKITIAIISKDRKKLLIKCLHSITLQTKKPDELILVEDITDNQNFNKDKIQKIIGDGIPIIYKAVKAKNYAKSRNQCVNATSSDILLFVDDDVILPVDYIKKTLSFHQNNQGITGVVGKIFPRNDNRISKYQSSLYMGPLRFQRKIKKVTTYSFTTISLKINLIKNQNIIFDERLYTAEDYDFIIKCNKKKNKIVFSPEFRVFHKFNSNIIKFFLRYIQFGESMYELKKRYPNIFDQNSYDYPLFCNYLKYTNWDRQYLRLDSSYFLLCLLHRICLTTGIYKKKAQFSLSNISKKIKIY